MTEHVLQYDRAIAPQETGFWCGPASAQMVLNTRGIVRSETDLAREIGTTQRGTDFVGLIETVLDRYLPLANYTSVYIENDPATDRQKQQLWADIVGSVNAGYGVVVNIVAPPSNKPRGVKGSQTPAYSGGTTFHYISAMGYDDDPALPAVWIADSGFRPFGYWVSFDQLATLIPPKGYAYANVQQSIEEMVSMPSNQEKFDDIHRETVTQKSGSRSWFAGDGNLIDTPLGVAWNTDGNEWNMANIIGHLAGVPWCVDAVKKVAAGDFGTGSYISTQPWLQQMAQSYCKTLVPLEGVLKKIR